jgi:hypothetical protein
LLILPSWLVGLFNPAHAYMERMSRTHRGGRRGRRQRGQPFPEAVVLGSGVHGARAATAKELRLIRAQSQEGQRLFEARLAAIEKRYSSLLQAKASELIGTGTTTMVTSAGEVQARILRFRWGADVLEITRPGGEGRSTLQRSHAREPAVLISFLAHALADVSIEGEPLLGA